MLASAESRTRRTRAHNETVWRWLIQMVRVLCQWRFQRSQRTYIPLSKQWRPRNEPQMLSWLDLRGKWWCHHRRHSRTTTCTVVASKFARTALLQLRSTIKSFFHVSILRRGQGQQSLTQLSRPRAEKRTHDTNPYSNLLSLKNLFPFSCDGTASASFQPQLRKGPSAFWARALGNASSGLSSGH